MALLAALGVVVENLLVMVRDHGGARAGGDNNGIGIREDVEKMTRDGARLLRISTIQGGLATTGLSFQEIDLVTEPLDHLGHGDSDLREHLIDDAGYKERDARHELQL